MKKNNLLILAVIAVGGYILYKKWKDEQTAADVTADQSNLTKSATPVVQTPAADYSVSFSINGVKKIGLIPNTI